jgi:hypothetical protein
MQFILHCIDDEAHRRYAIKLDEECFFCPPGERPIDILMGILADVSYQTAPKVVSALKALNENGHQSYVDSVAPGAIRMICAHPSQRLDHHLSVTFDFKADTVQLIDGTRYDLRAFKAPTERLDRRSMGHRNRKKTDHPLSLRYISDGESCNLNDLQGGSITLGILSALTPGPYGAYTEGLSMLTGLMIGESGLAFGTDISGPRRGGSQTMSSLRRNLMSDGILSSNRAFCPDEQLRGAIWDEIASVVDPLFAELGNALGPVLAKIDAATCNEMLFTLLERLGEDPVQYHLDRWNRQKTSAHQQLKIEGSFIALQQILDTYEKEVIHADA